MNGDQDETQEGGFLQRLQESPRTVSALIIILIVAAAIYAFSGDEDQGQVAETGAGEETESEGMAASDEMRTDEEMTDEEMAGRVAAGMAGEQTTEAGRQAAEEVVLKEAERTAEGFVEVAQAGEGLTHLARRASTQWLSENQVGFSVTDEHRIYIEDYIQNQLGTSPLSLGQDQLISFDLIQEAVNAAGELNEDQLKNLTKYTSALR